MKSSGIEVEVGENAALERSSLHKLSRSRGHSLSDSGAVSCHTLVKIPALTAASQHPNWPQKLPGLPQLGDIDRFRPLC